MATDPIKGVLTKLEAIVDWSLENNSRIGYFAALYLRVTNTIYSKIGTGYFEDDARMERMDVNFAGRYLAAVEQYQNGDPALPSAWKVAFDATNNERLIIVQQLFLSMNPHINIDLGVAAAETCPGSSINGFQTDFDKINELLASLVPTVIEEIGELSPLIHILDNYAEKPEESIINFSMKMARDFAWKLALELAPLTPEQQAPIINKRNGTIAQLGEKIIDPGSIFEEVVRLINTFESKDVTKIINTLNSGNPVLLKDKEAQGYPVRKVDPEDAANYTYYFKIAHGSWTGTFNFTLKSWSGLFASNIGLKNKFLVTMMVIFQKVFGDASISSTITTYPDEGPFGVARNDFRIHKGWFTLFRSNESYTLSVNGHGVTVDAHVRFGPVFFLFNEHDIYPATIYDKGYRAAYHIKLLATRFLGQYTVSPDGKEVHSILDNNWATADETLNKIE